MDKFLENDYNQETRHANEGVKARRRAFAARTVGKADIAKCSRA